MTKDQTYSTEQAAKLANISLPTLKRWLRDKKVKVTTEVPLADRVLRRWTAADIKKLKDYKAKNYWSMQNRKKRKGHK